MTAPDHQPSATTQLLIEMLTQRDAHGLAKYGTTLDRTDLTPAQWLQHLTEELLDGAGYAQAMLREFRALIAIDPAPLRWCALDRDECTVTLCFDDEAAVNQFIATHASGNRVRVVADDLDPAP